VADQCGRRGASGTVSARQGGAVIGPCQLRVVPEGERSGRLSCAVVHLLSTILALSLDPKEILNDLSPYGEIGLMLIIFAETGLLVGFFLPGDSLLFTAGILANQGKLNLAAILIGCFVAAVVGDQLGFTIGQKTGPRLLRRPDSKLFKREYIDRTEDFFDQHGAKTIVLARFVPIVRTFAPVVAGIGKMSRKTFFSFNVIGGFVWVFGVTLAGYFLADAIGDSIDTYLYPLIAAIIIISLIPPFLEWRKAKNQRPVHFTQAQAEAEAAALHDVVEED
jgi:membrane-associated protein